MKKPFLSAAQLRQIAAEYPTPFHLYDEAGIRANARRLQKAFAWNPKFKEYFAVKATPNPVILQILKEEGCGVDCSTLTELMLAEAVGFSGEEIMFSANMTPWEDFQYAYRLGAILNLDDFTDLEYFPDLPEIPRQVCLRYNPGGEFSLSNQIMDTPQEAKYGLTKEQLKEAVLRLQHLGVEKFGLHAFLTSNTIAPDYYPTLARMLFAVAVELRRETGAFFSLINLSGGLGIPYRPGQKPVDIEAVADRVKQAFHQVLTPAGLGKAALVTELGRYMLGPYGHLVATAIREKRIYKHYIGLDACAAHLLRPAMYGAYHHITVVGKEKAPATEIYDVTGGLCENNDKFAVDRRLPPISRGDLVVIHDTGAHGFSMGYNYNGKLRCAEILLKEDGSTQLIRRAETPQDYFATLDLPLKSRT